MKATPPGFNLCACGCGGLTKSTWKTGHHRRAKGAKPAIATKPIKQRIAESTAETSSGCWEWQLSKCRDGYGRMKVAGKTLRAARVSYTEFKGPIPEGLLVFQVCKNRACVNPDHLEVITSKESVARGAADPKANFAACNERRRAATHCPHGHPWDDENTRYANGQRVCRACLRERMRERRAIPEFKEMEKKRNRELYHDNRDSILARKRAWRSANREEINARLREYRKDRYESLKAEGICIRVGCGEPVSSKVLCEKHRLEASWKNWGLKYEVPQSYEERGLDCCWMCGDDFDGDEPMWHDHLIPRSLGGPDEAWNLAPSHRLCNIYRSNTPLHETMRTAVFGARATSEFPEEYKSYLVE